MRFVKCSNQRRVPTYAGHGRILVQDQAPTQAASNCHVSASKTASSRILRAHLIPAPERTCPADRYIPRRREYSFEAANYLLTRRNENAAKKNKLDVFGQIEALPNSWRKRVMHKAMVKENVMPGLKQTQVLRGCAPLTDRKLAGSLIGKPMDLLDEECMEEGIWKTKPRKQPLIGIMDSILDMPGFHASSRFGFRLLDWSSTNIAAAFIRYSVMFFNTRSTNTFELEPLKDITVCALKWNSTGDKLAITTISSTINVYDIVTQKYIWTASCSCLATFSPLCLVRCVCWSKDDKYIITGCRTLSVYNASNSRLVQSICAHNYEILAISFSPNYRYLVTTADDKNVRVYAWPCGFLYLQIGHYESVKAVAWHPEENGLLCIGGGLHDAPLSLWNVNKQDAFSYRRVKFRGCVENLAWNKLSGELVVHWSYWEDRKRRTVIPILASLDRIVDTIPVDKNDHVGQVLWNWDHTQLATQANQSLMIWDFFGSGYRCPQKVNKSIRDTVRRPTIGARMLNHFIIR